MRDTSWENLITTVFDDKFVTPCVAGKKLIVVSEEGQVFPCEILGKDKSFGNLRDYSMDVYKLIKDQKAKEVNKFIKDTKCKCSFECAFCKCNLECQSISRNSLKILLKYRKRFKNLLNFLI